MRLLANKFFLLGILILIAYSCRQKKYVAKNNNNTKTEHVKTGESNALKEKLGLTSKEIKENKLYRFVDEWYGTPYKYGGCLKSGVDCSCFTIKLYENVYGKTLARSASDIYKECDKVGLDKIKQGDLLFFKINGNSISHVGVYLKSNKFVHASTSKGVIINDLNEAYYKKYFYTAGRLKRS